MNQKQDDFNKNFSLIKKILAGLVMIFIIVIGYYVFSLYSLKEDAPEAFNQQSFKYYDVSFIDNKQTLENKDFKCLSQSDTDIICSQVFRDGITVVVNIKDNVIKKASYSGLFHDLESCSNKINQVNELLLETKSAEFDKNPDENDSSYKGVITELNENGKDVMFFYNKCLPQKDDSFVFSFVFSN